MDGASAIPHVQVRRAPLVCPIAVSLDSSVPYCHKLASLGIALRQHERVEIEVIKPANRNILHSTECLGGPLIAALGRLSHRISDTFAARTGLILIVTATIAVVSYWLAVIGIATERRMWFDELFSFFVASQESPAALWQALLDGMDLHPPLHYLVRQISLMIFGANELALRLPSALAIFAGAILAGYFSLRTISALAAIWTVTALLLSPAFPFAYEGRGYADLVLWNSAALCAWLQATRSSSRANWWWWFLLGLLLTFCAWTHFYGVLSGVCAGIATLALWIEKRGIVWKSLIPFIVMAIGAIPVIPFALASSSYSSHFWTVVPRSPLYPLADVIQFSAWSGAPLLVLAACLLIVRARASSTPFRGSPSIRRSKLGLADTALLLSLFALPILQWLLAMATGAYLPRYVIQSAVAASVLLGYALSLLARRLPSPLASSALLALMLCLGRFVFAYRGIDSTIQDARQRSTEIEISLRKSPGMGVSPEALNFLVDFYYGSDWLKEHLYLSIDRNAALRLTGAYQGTDSLPRLARFVPLRLIPYDQLIEGNVPLNITTDSNRKQAWLVRKLMEDGWHVALADPGRPRIAYVGHRGPAVGR